MVLIDEAKEDGHVEVLTGLMGGVLDREAVRRVLRKYDGDIDKAATAMIDGGERGDALPQLWRSNSQPDIGAQKQLIAPTAVRPNTPVTVDLTGDDDGDLQRAMRESMNTIQPQPVFGPSERPSDPNWAVVPSQV